MTESQTMTFWQKHWRWFVPVVLLGPVLIMTLTCGSFVWSIWRLHKSLPAYQMTIQAVETNARVLEILGQPIIFDEMISGDVNIHNDEGHAHLSFGVAGPTGEGMIESKSTMTQGKWSLDHLTVTIYEDGKATQTIEVVTNDLP